MHKHGSPHRAKQVAYLTASGDSAAEIADALGISVSSVYRYRYEARQAQQLPRVEPKSMYSNLQNRLFTSRRFMGNMRNLINLLSKEEVDFLFHECPEDFTIAEFIATMVRDAIAEERK